MNLHTKGSHQMDADKQFMPNEPGQVLIWSIFWRCFCGTPLNHPDRRSLPMQCGARFLFLGYRSTVQHEINEGNNNMYKTIEILHILDMKGMPGAVNTSMPKNNTCKTKI